MDTLDLMPLVEALMTLALAIGVPWALLLARKHLGLTLAKQDADALAVAVQRAMQFGLAKVAGDDRKITTNNFSGIAGAAVGYLVETSPSLVARTAGGLEPMRKRIEAELAREMGWQGAVEADGQIPSDG